MTPVNVLWMDADRQQASQALQLMAVHYPHWHVVHIAAPDARGALLASQAWDALVLCPGASVQDVPALVAAHADKVVLMCLDACQEAVAAQAFRRGLSDYVLRHPDGVTHLDELLQRLEAALVQRAQRGASGALLDANMSRRTLALLQEQRQALQVTLASMSQGILKTAPDGRITVYNQRVLELLDLPESVMADRPSLEGLGKFQMARGDFGASNELLDSAGDPPWSQDPQGVLLAVYLRGTRDGRTLEVRTKALEGGGIVRTFSDVSDYVRVQNELRESEARFRSLNDLSSDWYWESDVDGRFVQLAGDLSVNGLSNAQVIGRTRWEIGALNMTDNDWGAHQTLLLAQVPFRDLELQRERPDGTMHWISVSGVPVYDAQGMWRGYRGVGRDISDRKLAALQIERLAFYDVLTGLPNRRLLVDRLQRATALAARSGAHGALLFIDLDNFKDLNDTLGHDMGDRLLTEVARRLTSCVRMTDTVARFGGDEFVVLLESLHAQSIQAGEEAALVACGMAATLGQPYVLGDASHHSTPSIGITLFGVGGQASNVDELLKQADLAMYQAKAAGRNTHRFFDPAMQAAASARSALESDLRRGLQAHEMLLYYQPVVDSRGRLQGAEGLVRWHHPQRGLVMPLEFIPLAEQTGLILPLGRRVIEMACAQLVVWSHSLHTRDLVLSINVSVRQFRQPDFVDQVLGALRTSGAKAERLKLELTESLLMADVEEVIERMDCLRSSGVHFSLDDFGTGYSSLSYLKRLPLDQLKIDRSFVRDLQTDPNDAAIVRTILALAHSLDLAVVAEGVETTGQLEFLKRHGCDSFQGYLFGRPMPPEMLVRALSPAM